MENTEFEKHNEKTVLSYIIQFRSPPLPPKSLKTNQKTITIVHLPEKITYNFDFPTRRLDSNLQEQTVRPVHRNNLQRT